MSDRKMLEERGWKPWVMNDDLWTHVRFAAWDDNVFSTSAALDIETLADIRVSDERSAHSKTLGALSELLAICADGGHPSEAEVNRAEKALSIRR